MDYSTKYMIKKDKRMHIISYLIFDWWLDMIDMISYEKTIRYDKLSNIEKNAYTRYSILSYLANQIKKLLVLSMSAKSNVSFHSTYFLWIVWVGST